MKKLHMNKLCSNVCRNIPNHGQCICCLQIYEMQKLYGLFLLPGECGLRGGYVELTNFHPETVAELYKLVSVQLCPNTIGQLAVALMVNPPKEGDPSYEAYKAEREDELASLKRRALMVTKAFNSLEGVTCNKTEGE